MMKVHRVRTRTLLLFLLAFSASASALGGEEEVTGPFTLFEELGTGPEKGGACFAGEELEGRSGKTFETG